MVLVHVNELSEKIDSMVSMVAKGEIFIITKEGIPFAELIPFKSEEKPWKKKIKKIKLPKGVSTLSYIQEERNLI